MTTTLNDQEQVVARRMGEQSLADAARLREARYQREAIAADAALSAARNKPVFIAPPSTQTPSTPQWGPPIPGIRKILLVAVVSVAVLYGVSMLAGLAVTSQALASYTAIHPALTGLASFSGTINSVVAAIYTGFGNIFATGAVAGTASLATGAGAAVTAGVALTSTKATVAALAPSHMADMSNGTHQVNQVNTHDIYGQVAAAKKSTVLTSNSDVDLPEIEAEKNQQPQRSGNSTSSFIKKTGETNADQYARPRRTTQKQAEQEAQIASMQAQARMQSWAERTSKREPAPKITERPAPVKARAQSHTAQALEERRIALQNALKGPTPA
jgi:hypothetical protein